MLLSGLKVAALFFFSAIALIILVKVIWMNVTPGYYRLHGCCSYSYLSDAQFEEERKKINICPKIRCTIEDTTSYKVNELFNHLDFNK